MFDPALDDDSAIRDDKLWVQRIKAGLSENRFHLTTQWIAPSPALAENGEVYEVFLALEDDEGFWATPADFMPVAHRHHLTADIDRWVLRATVRHLAENREARERIAFVSINLSGQSLTDPELLEAIVDTLQKYPVQPDMLCFEISEEAIAEHPNEARRFFECMKAVGCRLAIDRFQGCNMQDIELMRSLSVDIVKLDAMSFRRVHKDPLERAVVDALLSITHTLKKQLIVYNLDEPHLVDAWKQIGSDYVQGFAIAKPTPLIFKPV